MTLTQEEGIQCMKTTSTQIIKIILETMITMIIFTIEMIIITIISK